MRVRSGNTAIHRNHPSAPVRWLSGQGLLSRPFILDYGCGRGDDCEYLHCFGYDPVWAPDEAVFKYRYNVVLCTYVLNVVSLPTRKKILRHIVDLLVRYGVVYLTVRRDITKPYRTVRCGPQYVVTLPFRSLHRTANFEVYEATRNEVNTYLIGKGRNYVDRNAG